MQGMKQMEVFAPPLLQSKLELPMLSLVSSPDDKGTRPAHRQPLPGPHARLLTKLSWI